jgi:hypothetical protein
MKRTLRTSVIALLAASNVLSAYNDEGPHFSRRCQRFVDRDASARADWKEAMDSGARKEKAQRLHVEFLDRHEELFASGCLVS